jgi:hypothetical protein
MRRPIDVRFQVFTGASIQFRVFWDVAPCSHVEVDRRFRSAYCLHHQSAPLPVTKWNIVAGSWFASLSFRSDRTVLHICTVHVITSTAAKWTDDTPTEHERKPVGLSPVIKFSYSFPFPFVPLQRRGCLMAPLSLWIVLVPCAGD